MNQLPKATDVGEDEKIWAWSVTEAKWVRAYSVDVKEGMKVGSYAFTAPGGDPPKPLAVHLETKP